MTDSRKALALIITTGSLVCTPAAATSLSVVGLFKDKAVVSIDGGKPRMIAVGQTLAGVKLIAADSLSARFEVNGAPRTLGMGQSVASRAPQSERQSVTLAADARGHFVAAGSVNGYPLTFLVDTGATSVALGAADARRLGIDYKSGRAGTVGTAGGVVSAWYVTLNVVKVGGITLNQVDAVVVESGLAVPLLGMSFLNRMEMQRDGQTMTLTRRY